MLCKNCNQPIRPRRGDKRPNQYEHVYVVRQCHNPELPYLDDPPPTEIKDEDIPAAGFGMEEF